jgi:integrase
MSLNYADYGYTLQHLGSVITASFPFNPDIPISKKSRFGDPVWDWTDEHNARLKVVDDSKVRFDWSTVTIGTEACHKAILHSSQKFLAMLPEEMVEDIRRAIFIFAMFPSLFIARGKSVKEGRKGITVITRTKDAVNFFSHVYLQNLLPNGVARIHKLSDITIKDIQKAADNYPYHSGAAKQVLAIFGNEYIQSNLKYGRLQWNRLDLRNIRWRAGKVPKSIETLPDMLFRLLSNRSCDLIGSFLTLMGVELRDAQAGVTVRDVYRHKWPNFPVMFESYIERRKLIKEGNRSDIRTHTEHFNRRFGFHPEVLMNFLFDVQCAAQVIILLYTGMRYSEAVSIRIGCLSGRNGVHLIKSTLIKGRRTNLPLDEDEWVAIDIVQDAVRALEALSRCTFNKFLFSNFETVKVGKKENPLSNGGLSQRLNQYLDRVDTEHRWVKWKLSPHQFRHGLTHQLAKAEVGIPYITRQLHHFHTRLIEGSYKSNDTSTIYGMQRQRIVENATGLNAMKDAKLQVVHALYGEGRKFAGGGAAIHVERTEGFFAGQGLYGESRENYLNKFAEFGGTMIRTGVGWCIRNHVDPRKLKEELPPCIGDLNCNPHTCSHSVVPESRAADVIDQYRNAVKNLNSPDQTHLRKHWEFERNSFASMLKQLGYDPENILKEETHVE